VTVTIGRVGRVEGKEREGRGRRRGANTSIIFEILSSAFVVISTTVTMYPPFVIK
jgi:hypothetical protein